MGRTSTAVAILLACWSGYDSRRHVSAFGPLGPKKSRSGNGSPSTPTPPLRSRKLAQVCHVHLHNSNTVGSSSRDEENNQNLQLPWLARPSETSNPESALAAAKYSLVMMRHGESAFNSLNVFTGWCDVPLTEKGRAEATKAGEILGSRGLEFDVVYCSVLQRATVTSHLALEACGQSWVEVRPRWQLNERHYGGLQGLSKDDVARRRGDKVTRQWRQGYHVRPPEMDPTHPHWNLLNQDRRYQSLVEAGTMPLTESLADTAVRVMDLWTTEIAPLVKEGKRVLIVAHRNSLRALIRNLENLTDDQVARMKVPTGQPFIYPLEEKLRPIGVPISCDEESQSDADGCGFQGVFLTDGNCERNYAAMRRKCLIEWEGDPANPPKECWDLDNDECTLSY